MSAQSTKLDLAQGLEALGLKLSDEQIKQLKTHLDLLQKWGKVYNLTAVRDPAEMLTHHLLDSLSVLPALNRHLTEWQALQPVARPLRVLDVGSGAGLPGLVLALALPELDLVCVDAVAKKAAFIQQAALAMKLSNLKAVHGRVENLQGPFDLITSRAFASLADFTRLTRQALTAEGVWMAMKGKRPDAEIAELDASQAAVFHVEPLQVPGLNAERCLVWLRPQRMPAGVIT